MKIYAIGTENMQKIGFSKEPKSRLKQLQTGNGEKLFLHYAIEVPEERARLIERYIHKEMKHKSLKGEWFSLSKQEAIDLLIFAEIRWVDDPLLEYKI